MTQKCALFSIYLIKGKPDEEQLTELKQELDIDFHRIPVSELCQRLGTNLETGLTGAQVYPRTRLTDLAVYYVLCWLLKIF